MRRPTQEDRDALDQLLAIEELTEWEAAFVESLANQDVWSTKQGEKFDEVWETVKGK